MDNSSLNLSKICRVCLVESEEMHSIFSELVSEDNLQEETSYLYEILMNISNMKVAVNDGLPTLICTNCMELAHTVHKFQQQCNRSQAILEAYVSQTQNEQTQIEENNADMNIETLQGESNGLPDFFNSPRHEGDEMDILEEKVNYEMLNESNDNAGLLNIKTETNSETSLNASEVAGSEENMKLRQRLAFKRIHASVTPSNNFGIRRRATRLNFNYYIQENTNGEKEKVLATKSLPGQLGAFKIKETVFVERLVYACNLCDKMYKYGSSLKIHMRTHTLERPYVCSICGKDFKQYGSLIYHNRSHTGEQPYSCKICGKRYKQSGTLTAHMRVHTGQRPYLCSVCGRGFRQAPDLGYHMRTHTKEKPYMCNVCGKTMSMQCHLTQHMRTHTGERPFKCSECNKAFPSSTRLKRHAIIHTGLKPYTCEVCDKSFNRSSSLRVHAKIHTDERPHVCPVCGKGFIQAHALRGHVLTHSSEQDLRVKV